MIPWTKCRFPLPVAAGWAREFLPMNIDQLGSLIRAIVKIGGGYLIAKGVASDNQVEAISAGVLALAAVLWGYYHRSSVSQKQ